MCYRKWFQRELIGIQFLENVFGLTTPITLCRGWEVEEGDSLHLEKDADRQTTLPVCEKIEVMADTGTGSCVVLMMKEMKFFTIRRWLCGLFLQLTFSNPAYRISSLTS